MSDTPRTDKAIADDSGDSGYINKLAQHARQLERELAEANQRIRELTEWRPMEDAPRDGTDIDLTNGASCFDGCWLFGAWLICGRRFTDRNFKGWLPKRNP